MTLTIYQWHQRYQQQAHWTQNLRNYVYEQVEIKSSHRILDVGCGTGIILDELTHLSPASLFGLDISLEALSISKQTAPLSLDTQADALHLPFSSASFDLSLCHFVLLWIHQPLQALQEMARVTRNGGFLCALAEPDYGGRIDFPPELSEIGIWQTEALREQGANPQMGRELRALFADAGLQDIEVGVLGGQWRKDAASGEFELEWEVIQSDLQYKKEFVAAASELKSLELSSRTEHQRVLFVPTFYAFGKVNRSIKL